MQTFKTSKAIIIARSVMVLMLSSCVMSLSDEKTPIDLGDDRFDEIGQAFISFLSDDLRAKLSNKTDKDGPIDMDNLDPGTLTDDEKKEIESALKKAFEPVFGDFAKMLTESGIPEKDIKIETKTTDVPKQTDDKKSDVETTDNNESIKNDEQYKNDVQYDTINKQEL